MTSEAKARRLRDDPDYDQDSYVSGCHQSVLYLIGTGSLRRPVKVGRTNNIKRRMGNLQQGSHYTLSLLGTIPGGPVEEKAVRLKYQGSCVRGEWFRPTAALLSEFGLTKEATHA